MLKIYCNANVYNGLIQGRYPKPLIDKFKAAKENGGVSVFWIPTNLFELVQGVKNEHHFQNAKDAVSNMLNISDEKMLDDPKLHVQKAVCRYLSLKEPPTIDDFLIIAQQISKAASLKTIQKNISEWQIYLSNFFNLSWLPKTEQLAEELKKIYKGEYVTPTGHRVTVDEFLGALTESILWPAIKHRFEIEAYVKNLNHLDVVPRVPAIWFWYAVVIGYYRKLGEDCRKPVSSDFVDIEQIEYLDVMDFFVFEDAKFKAVLKRSLLPELAQKCLGLEEFIRVLQAKKII